MSNVLVHPAFEAGARAAPPVPQDASAGLTTYTDAQGAIWAYNPIDKEWQRLHQIVSGDTLWKLSGTYYGGPSLEAVRAIHGVPQNKAIQGGSPDIGLIPNDIILIPQLPQPVAPPGTGGGSQTPIGEVPQSPGPVVAPPDATVPGEGVPGTFPISYPISETPPPGWPPGYPWPPVAGTPPLPEAPVPGEIIVPTPGEIPPPTAVPVGLPVAAAPEEEKFWTTGKIAAAGVAGVAGVGILWALMRRGGYRRRRRGRGRRRN